MLEREGSVIPLDTIFEGPRRSPFSVCAVTQCNLLLLEADELAQLLEAYPVADANSVSLALDAEYKGLVDSLKVNRDSSPEPRGTMERTQSAPQAARASPTAHASLKEQIEQLENTVKVLNGTVLTLKMDADKVPQLLKLLVSRVAGLRLPSQVHDGSRNGGSSFFATSTQSIT